MSFMSSQKTAEQQEAIKTVSGILAELFDTDVLEPPLIFATAKEIQKMQEEENIAALRVSSYVRGDGTVVILKPRKGSKTDDTLHSHLASEFAHVYHKAVGGDNCNITFNPSWVYYSNLIQTGDSSTIVLPRAMVERAIIPKAKAESCDRYCVDYVLSKLEYDDVRVTSMEEFWYQIMETDIKTIKETIENSGACYPVILVNLKKLMKKHSSHEDPLFNLPYSFCNLTAKMVQWMSEIYFEGISEDVYDFRNFVRTPILPTARADISTFERSIQKFDKYLTSKGFYGIGYNKKLSK